MELEEKEALYLEAKEQLKEIVSISDVEDVVSLLNSIGDYKDAKALAEECEENSYELLYRKANALMDEDRLMALEIYRGIEEYSDVRDIIASRFNVERDDEESGNLKDELGELLEKKGVTWWMKILAVLVLIGVTYFLFYYLPFVLLAKLG